MAENYGELSRLFAARQAPMQMNPRATSAIAQAFTNGPAQQANWAKGAQQGATLADVMAQARQRQLNNVGVEGLAKIAEGQGNFKRANMIRAGGNAEALAKAWQTDSTNENQELRDKEALDPNSVELLDRQAAARAKEPFDITKVEGGSIINRFKGDNDQSYRPTAVGQSEMALHGAESTNALAHAGEANAQAARARAGIGVDKAGNYETKEDADGNLIRVNRLNPNDTQPITMGGKPVTGKVAEKFGEKLPEPILGPLLADPGGDQTKPSPAMAARFVAEKQRLGPKASDADVIQSLRAQDASAQTGPTVDPNPPGTPGTLATMFGAKVGNDTGQPYPDANAVAMPATPPGAPAAAPAPSTGKPSLQEFLTSARVHNPGKSDSELVDYYNATYGQ